MAPDMICRGPQTSGGGMQILIELRNGQGRFGIAFSPESMAVGVGLFHICKPEFTV